MAFRHVIADSDGKLRRNLGKSIGVPSTEIVVPSPSIFRKGLGQSSPVETIQCVETPKTSLIRKGLGKSVAQNIVFFDSCSSSTLPPQIINTISPSYDATNKRRVGSVFSAGSYQTSRLYLVGDTVYPRIEISTLGGTGDFVFRFYLNGFFAYQLYFQFNNIIGVYDKNSTLITSANSIWNSGDYWQIIPIITASNVRFLAYELRGGNQYDSGNLAHTNISVSNSDNVSWYLGCSPLAGYSYASVFKD